MSKKSPQDAKKQSAEQKKQATISRRMASLPQNMARTRANRAKRIAKHNRDVQLKAERAACQAAQPNSSYHTPEGQHSSNLFYLSQRMRAQHIKQQVQKITKVKILKDTAASLYKLEARAHLTRMPQKVALRDLDFRGMI
jgi:hypothetical protein